MFTVPNFISFLRIPLAFLFLKESVLIRTFAVILAMITDGLDGFIARRFNVISKIGTVLDPLTDRFFVFFILGIFLYEGKLTTWEASTLVCRDVALFLFAIYITLKGKFSNYEFRAIWCGKATTFLQFINFLALTLGAPIPAYLYGAYIVLGVLAFAELYLSKESIQSQAS